MDRAAIGAAVAGTLALVLPYYARRPFWFDEIASVEIAGLSPRWLVEYVFGMEANMALYHAVLSAWLSVTAEETGVRALSIAFALLTLPFLYALAQRLFDRTTAAIAVLLISVNVSYVGYSHDARSYALTLLLVTASSFYLVRALDRSRPRDWAFYVTTAALAVWAHLFAALVVAAQLAWLLLARPAGTRRDATVAVATLAALLLPLGLAIVLGGQHAQLDWLPRPRPQKIPGLFHWYVESWATLALYFVGVAALVAALADWRRQPPRWPRRESFLLLWLFLPPVVAFGVSYATPVYLYRYFLVCLPALVLLVAAGFARLRPAWLGVALAAAAVALSVRTVESCQPDCKIRHDDWKAAAAAYLESRVRPDDAIIFYPSQVRTPMAHYLGLERPRLLFPARWGLTGGAEEGADRLDAAMRVAERHRRIWLVTWWLPSESAHAALASRAARVDAREFQGNVHLELYRPREPAT